MAEVSLCIGVPRALGNAASIDTARHPRRLLQHPRYSRTKHYVARKTGDPCKPLEGSTAKPTPYLGRSVTDGSSSYQTIFGLLSATPIVPVYEDLSHLLQKLPRLNPAIIQALVGEFQI